MSTKIFWGPYINGAAAFVIFQPHVLLDEKSKVMLVS